MAGSLKATVCISSCRTAPMLHAAATNGEAPPPAAPTSPDPDLPRDGLARLTRQQPQADVSLARCAPGAMTALATAGSDRQPERSSAVPFPLPGRPSRRLEHPPQERCRGRVFALVR